MKRINDKIKDMEKISPSDFTSNKKNEWYSCSLCSKSVLPNSMAMHYKNVHREMHEIIKAVNRQVKKRKEKLGPEKLSKTGVDLSIRRCYMPGDDLPKPEHCFFAEGALLMGLPQHQQEYMSEAFSMAAVGHRILDIDRPAFILEIESDVAHKHLEIAMSHHGFRKSQSKQDRDPHQMSANQLRKTLMETGGVYLRKLGIDFNEILEKMQSIRPPK
jgi:hypothetical protein